MLAGEIGFDSVGTDPDDVAERIGAYARMGFTHLVLHAPGPDQARAIGLLSRDVLPRLRRALS